MTAAETTLCFFEKVLVKSSMYTSHILISHIWGMQDAKLQTASLIFKPPIQTED